MNREVKAAIGFLLLIIGLIAYLEMGQDEVALPDVEPIEDVTLVPEPVEVKVLGGASATPSRSEDRTATSPAVAPKPVTPKPVAPVVAPQPRPESVAPTANSAVGVSEEPKPSSPAPVAASSAPVQTSEKKSDKIAVEASFPSQYRVKKGDTLSGISESVLGSIWFQKAFLEANPELQPHDKLVPGMILQTPQRATLEEIAARVNEKSEGDYVIQKGDNLYKISKSQLGTSKRVSEIMELNPQINPLKLQVGAKIKLPK